MSAQTDLALDLKPDRFSHVVLFKDDWEENQHRYYCLCWQETLLRYNSASKMSARVSKLCRLTICQKIRSKGRPLNSRRRSPVMSEKLSSKVSLTLSR